jgi:gamma-glutamylaminecyclotransferase
MILNEAGTGDRIEGELYEVDDVGLARLDRLESVGVPGNFRWPIEVESIDGNVKCTAFVFMKAVELTTPIHSGYLVSYQDRRFITPEHRDGAA